MRRYLLTIVTVLVSVVAAAPAAQALVVDMNATGQTSIAYNSSNQSGYFGVALTPGTCGDLATAGTCASLSNVGVPTVTSSAPCLDPALTSDLWTFGQLDRLPNDALCYHGGPVTHQNETFALTWDAPFPTGSQHNYWSDTRKYVEQFLRDLADGSGSLTSPYAITTQYTDANGRAHNSSKYGGGCIDYGVTGGSQCEFDTAGAGHDFPVSGCPVTGASSIGLNTTIPNTVCLTDAQLQGEVSTMVAQTGILGRTQPGYTPVVTLLMPPGVATCLDAASKLCSANDSLTPPPASLVAGATGGSIPLGTYRVEIVYVTASGEQLPGASGTVTTTSSVSTISLNSPPPASGVTGWYAYVASASAPTFTRWQSSPTAIGTNLVMTSLPSSGAPPRPSFCSYHSQVDVGGTEVAYVVQPWTGLTGCDEPDAPVISANPPPQQLATDMGIRLVSPLSQSQISSIVDPSLNGWFALNGAEMNDNGGCTPLGGGLDSVRLGSSSQNPYLLQREFNNAGAIESDPNTYFGCAPGVILSPAFVVPSAINQGDELQLDGSISASTLMVPNSGYSWDFGDGATATGPSVLHTYTKGGTYTIKLTTTDRGGNQASLSQIVSVLDQNGNAVTSSPSGTAAGQSGNGSPGSGSGPPPALQVHLLLMPQSLKTALRSGIAVRVSSNQAVDGFAWIYISRAAAERVHIRVGRGPSVVIGQGTVARIENGTALLRLHLSRGVAAKLMHLRHVTFSVRLQLAAASGDKLAVVAAAHY
jgi:PKD domain-containing protein